MRKDTIATRKRIVDTAERLFAEKGVEATSLLDITKTAEQKNRSALQYHFKNKEGLLHAVLDKHSIDIAKRRTAMLDQLEKKGNFTLYDLVEALVVPLAQEIDNEDGGRHFLKIHGELMSTRKYRALRVERHQDFNDIQRMQAMGETFVTFEDIDEISAKGILIGCVLIHGLANYLPARDVIPRDIFIRTLNQSIVDLLLQPTQN